MTYREFSVIPRGVQPSPGILELQGILDAINTDKLLARLASYRWTGRRGYSPASMWRAFLASYVLNLPSTTALVRRLQDDLELRLFCGFAGGVPHRSSFSRFFTRLTGHQDLVGGCLKGLTDELAGLLPDFGKMLAIDSTIVEAHSNPNRRRTKNDPDATWTMKPDSDGNDHWYFGYKHHLVADAAYGVPVTGFTTTASRGDSPTLPHLLKQAKKAHEWLDPGYVLADKGYDSMRNHKVIAEKYDAYPIIPIRKRKGGQLQEGIYTDDGVPTCIGGVPMVRLKHDTTGLGDLYRCHPAGCHLKARKGVRYCDMEIWERPRTDNPRLFPAIRRDSQEYKVRYAQRQSVERVFKSLKQSRRMEDHCFTGMERISLHCLMSVLAFQATALTRIRAGQIEYLRWQVRKVA